MSTQYPGGFITKSPVAPTTTAASGIWTVDQALQYVKAGTWPTPPLFIEDLFSTYLYTGTAATLSITNNINLSGNGGLVWTKRRDAINDNVLVDTTRGMTDASAGILFSNATDAQNTAANFMNASTTGYTLGAANGASTNASGGTYVSWTFREQSKFFDIVTYTGTGAAGNVSHALGTTPGFLIIKRVSSVGNWSVFARDGTSSSKYTYSYFNFSAGLNLTGGASATNVAAENLGYITSTTFDPNNLSGSGAVGNVNNINDSGVSYVAYLFAHNAGGFPANGYGSTDGISCGSYVGNGLSSGNQVTLGYEPQFVLVKRTDGATAWDIVDNMRGVYTSLDDYLLRANTTAVEVKAPRIDFNATGFSLVTSDGEFNASGGTYIYIAIRRGPMKTPTVGTSVLGLNARTGTSAFVTVTGGLTDDLAIIKLRSGGALPLWATRLTGNNYVSSGDTSGENTALDTILQTNPWDVMDGIKVGSTSAMTNANTGTYINYLMRRAPGFMDVVCYAGINPSITHNLGVTPEMYIVKCRSGSGVTTGRWYVYHTGYNTSSNYIALNTTDALIAATIWGSGPTSSVIGASGGTKVNEAGQTYIAYLFATLAGVSKVGSYTGTGALQTVNCGFTTGARFVLIKRTDSTGDWYTYDSARGMSSGTDPYFWMNSTAAEDATTNYVDTDTTGFKVTAAAPAELNAVGGNYIFLAIA